MPWYQFVRTLRSPNYVEVRRFKTAVSTLSSSPCCRQDSLCLKSGASLFLIGSRARTVLVDSVVPQNVQLGLHVQIGDKLHEVGKDVKEGLRGQRKASEVGPPSPVTAIYALSIDMAISSFHVGMSRTLDQGRTPVDLVLSIFRCSYAHGWRALARKLRATQFSLCELR